MDLPESLRDIASAIEEDKLFELITRFRGQKIHIPKSTSKWSLLPILGNEAALKLVQLCGGDDVVIPKCHRLFVAFRNEKIRADRANGLKINQLISKYSLSESLIKSICRKTPLTIACKLG